MSCPFGGDPGVFPTLAPAPWPLAPAPSSNFGYRVIPGLIWWNLVHLPWRKYLAARSANVLVPTPGLAPPGRPVYFTDVASLAGCQWPDSFPWRVGLAAGDQAESLRFGCAVVQFSVPMGTAVIPPPAGLPGVVPGLTVNGAREWVINNNVPLDPEMVVTYFDVISTGVRWFNVPL